MRPRRSTFVLGCVGFVLATSGCERRNGHAGIVLPQVPPETVVVSWSFISRSPDRRSTHAVLQASRNLTVTSRSADGTMMSVERQVPKARYAEMVGDLRELECCSLQSTRGASRDPSEAKPLLELDLGDMRCEVELWDHEWTEGRARECGLAVARVHRAGFVPEPPVDDAAP